MAIAIAAAAIAAGSAVSQGQVAGGDPAAAVNPFIGTASRSSELHTGNTFPGFSAPFGMLQWSPDTTGSNFGYRYRQSTIRGFSLTHLSGAGCAAYGDIAMMPTTSRVSSSPVAPGSRSFNRPFTAAFSHSSELASPGYYRVALDPGSGNEIDTELTGTTRSGIGRFTYPAGRPGGMLINAGSSHTPDVAASVAVDPQNQEVSGSASSGFFCNQRNRYTVYFVVRFSQPLRSFGTWTRQTLQPGSTAATDTIPTPGGAPKGSAQSGAYVSFDPSNGQPVEARVGISFVSVDEARSNLNAESGQRSFDDVQAAARQQWNNLLGRIEINPGSGPIAGQHLTAFYTALYHSLLAPRTFSDADGTYIGMDGQIQHTNGTQYADFSGWDVYRSEAQLLALIVPDRMSQMSQSLLYDAYQSGCLPKWSLANGQTNELVGDPADAFIASGWAFGATGFDTGYALAAMLRGARSPCRSKNANYFERPGIQPYKHLGYIPLGLNHQGGGSTQIGGLPNNVQASASTTLEYAIADFAIAQFAARSQNNLGAYKAFIGRSGHWRHLMHGDYITPRERNGAFVPDFSPTSPRAFAEGNAAQYTWMVPHDPSGLFAKLGGRRRAAARLRHFFRHLDAVDSPGDSPSAILSNEPNLHTPFLFNWAGRPDLSALIERRAIRHLFGAGAAGLPGNDDLGAMSSWYVFGSLGLYPEVPGVGMLVISSPLFPAITLHLAGGDVNITAPGADTLPFISSMQLNGQPYDASWLSYCSLAGGAQLSYSMNAQPSKTWGRGKGVPPSFSPTRKPPSDYCAL